MNRTKAAALGLVGISLLLGVVVPPFSSERFAVFALFGIFSVISLLGLVVAHLMGRRPFSVGSLIVAAPLMIFWVSSSLHGAYALQHAKEVCESVWIPAIEGYRSKHGSYPEDLTAPDFTALRRPTIAGRSFGSLGITDGFYQREGDTYLLFLNTDYTGMSWHQYSGAEQVWRRTTPWYSVAEKMR